LEKLPEPLERLITELSRLPTVGRKSAQRLAFHILKGEPQRAAALAQALLDVHSRLEFCPVCSFISDGGHCAVCRDPRRDKSVICVVEEPMDVVAFERSGTFAGLYHVLMGRLSPLHGVSPDDLRIGELMARVEGCEPTVAEVILATNPNVDGDATALYLARMLGERGIRCTRLGLGLSVGSSLEFADELTLRRAIEGRRGV
jgi:recombination protein RecR